RPGAGRAAGGGAPPPRPRNAALDCSRIARAFGIDAPSWRPALDGCVEALLRPTGGDDA
ncbi:MAG: sugar nucleotide-binding protein, partial [Rhodospirillaceae bacterium]|nr:sugar nucleotide-binding protein [Rhodospirillaceae bacterium]